MKARTGSNNAAQASDNSNVGVDRRDFLRLASAGLSSLVLPGCAERRESQMDSKSSRLDDSERLAAQQRIEREKALIKVLHQDRAHVVDELLKAHDVAPNIKRFLQDSQVSLRLEQVATVFATSKLERKPIDLKEVNTIFGSETQQLVAAFLQIGLKRAFVGLADEFERAVKKERPDVAFSLKGLGITVDPNIVIDGSWGARSSHLREGVQELRLRLSQFYYARPTPRPRQTLPLETMVEPATLATIRQYTPVLAAFMIPTFHNAHAGQEFEFQRNKENAKIEAGFGAPVIKSGVSFTDRMTPWGRQTPQFVLDSSKRVAQGGR